MTFWLQTDAKTGGKISGLTDAEVLETLEAKANAAHEAGHLNSEAGIRKAISDGPESARDYLAMMRIIGNAAKSIARGKP